MTDIIKKYKDIIANTTDYGVLQGIQQSILGWRHTDFVINNVDKYDVVALFKQDELLIDIVAQNLAINRCKKELIANNDSKYISSEDLKVSVNEAKLYRKNLTNEEIQNAINGFQKKVIRNPNPNESMMEFNLNVKNSLGRKNKNGIKH